MKEDQIMATGILERIRGLVSSEDQVRQVHDRFHDALGAMFSGDTSLMEDLWSHGTDVVMMSPLGDRLVGWTAVRNHFSQVAGGTKFGQISGRDLNIVVNGDTAYVYGDEVGAVTLKDGKTVSLCHRATSIYRREHKQWKMVLHHSDVSSNCQAAFGVKGGETSSSNDVTNV
jgi:ketosteroid isomerase-like protein